MDICQTRIDAGQDHSLARSRPRRIEYMFENLGELVLSERHMRLPSSLTHHHGIVMLRLAADAIFEDGQANIDGAGLSHALGAVVLLVARALGAREVDEVEDAVVGGGHAGYLDAQAADCVRPRRGVVLGRRLGAAELGGRLDERQELRRALDVVLERSGQLRDAECVLEDGDALPLVQQVCGRTPG